MKNLILFSLLCISALAFIGCKNTSVQSQEFTEVVNEHYELYKPNTRAKSILILFGGFPQTPEIVRREFKILETAKNNEIAVVFMNYSQKLYLTEDDKILLTDRINSIFTENDLPSDNVFIGGFSSGGIVNLILSNHLINSKNSIQPKGLFVVDSPVDLLELYHLAQRNLERNFSEPSINESKWLTEIFEQNFGKPENSIEHYEAFSPFTASTNNIENVKHLANLKLRFYSEPDLEWWKTNRQNDPIDLNAHWIEKLSNELSKISKNNSVQYIKTKNKGFRTNGERHPHSWSIVDIDELILWMLAEE